MRQSIGVRPAWLHSVPSFLARCTGIQFDCNVDCWLFLGTMCGDELPTSCGSSVYYKIAAAVASLDHSGSLNSSKCSSRYILRLTAGSQKVKHECLRAYFGQPSVDTHLSERELGSGGHRNDCNNYLGIRRTFPNLTPSWRGNCFPLTENDLHYDCQPNVYCSPSVFIERDLTLAPGNQDEALKLGEMSLTDCMAECEK